MAWQVSADPKRFDEAIAWFRKKQPVSREEWDQLTDDARAKAFTVAGVAQMSLVDDVMQSLQRALENGTTLEDFRAEVQGKLEREWKGSVKDPATRVETIFRTNMQLAYGAGRVEQATDPEVAAQRTYWMYDAVLDGRTSEICNACDGTVLPADDPWWRTHTPPCHFNCRSQIITLDEETALSMGVTSSPPTVEALKGFGGSPEINAWSPKKRDYSKSLWGAFKQKVEGA